MPPLVFKVISLIFGVTLLISCVPDKTYSSISSHDASAIYSAVIRRLTHSDATLERGLNRPTIYISCRLNKHAGEGGQPGPEQEFLASDIQEGIEQELATPGSRIIWIEQMNDSLFDKETGQIINDGVIIEIGPVDYDGQQAVVPGSIYVSAVEAGGTEYIVQFQNDRWIVTGRTDVQWAS